MTVEIISRVFTNDTFAGIESLVGQARLSRPPFDSALRRWHHHNWRPLVPVHQAMTEQASELFGVRLKPSYCFLSMYDVGGRLPLHVDRPPCFRTIDLMVRKDDDEPWPIMISERVDDDESAEGQQPDFDSETARIVERHEWTEVVLKPNAAVCYSGTHQWHYRPTEATARTDLIFFHFVPEDYDGPLD
jgi:hypothetical protein